MPAPVPLTPPPEDWWKVFGAAFGLLALGFLGWLKSILDGKREQPPVAGDIAAKAIGAGLVEKTTVDAVTAIADDFHELREIAERWESRVNQATAAELAELRRLAANRESPR